MRTIVRLWHWATRPSTAPECQWSKAECAQLRTTHPCELAPGTLENCLGGIPSYEGSNPSLSAICMI